MRHIKKTSPSLIGSITSLTFLQILNYVVPLLTIPYLTRVMGLNAYGEIAFILLIVSYFILFVEFGFPWSAVREISRLREEKLELSRVTIATWTIQWVLVIISGLTIVIFFLIFPNTFDVKKNIAIAFGAVIGSVLLPTWLFTGLELIKQMVVIQFFSKLITVIPIFVFIKDYRDIDKYLIIVTIGSLTGGFLSIYYINKNKIILFLTPSKKEIFSQIKNGYILFQSRLAISCYTILIPLIVGSFSGNNELAYYSLADRIKSAILSFFGIISQAIFPRVNYYQVKNKLSSKLLVKKYAIFSLLISLLMGIVIYFTSDIVINLLGGDYFDKSALILKYFSCLPFFITISNILGVQIMIPKYLNKEFNLILIICAVMGLLVSLPLVIKYGSLGGAQVVIMVEALISLIMIGYLRYKKII